MCRRRRLACLVLAVILVTPMLLGCNIVAPKPTPEPATVRYAVMDVVSEDWEPLIAAFQEEHPHITIEQVTYSSDIDVFLAPSFYLSMLRSETAGPAGMPHGLVALDAYAEADPDFALTDLDASAVDVLRQDGELWGIPAHVDLMMVYYNKDVFDLFGAPYPQPGWTWDEFLMTAGQVTSAGAGQFGYAPVDEVMDALAIVHAHGGWVLDDVSEPTRGTLNAPEVVDAMDWYASLIHVYNVAPTPDQVRSADFSSVVGSIYQGKIAMWMAGFSELGGSTSSAASFPAEWTFRWGMAPLPTEKRAAAMGQVNAYYVTEEAESPEACWTWIAWLTNRVPENGLPARKDILDSDAFEDRYGEDVAAMAREAMAETSLLSPDLVEFGPVFDALYTAIQSIQQGNKTPQEALDSAQERIDRNR